jgi:hypothetical protein
VKKNMISWFKVTRPDWAIMDDFEAIWIGSGGPVDAALFVQRNQRERTNEFFFTPAVAQLAPDLLDRYGATACEMPDFTNLSPFGMSLLVGDQSVIETPRATFQRHLKR